MKKKIVLYMDVPENDQGWVFSAFEKVGKRFDGMKRYRIEVEIDDPIDRGELAPSTISEEVES